jgi:hypothetical protein
MFGWLIKRIKDKYLLWRLDELQIGGHCGLCGKWVSDEILPKEWAITLCDQCHGGKPT